VCSSDLLIHGDYDPVAPYAQSEKMAAALKKAGKTCTFETLKGEGHSDWSTETWKTVLTKTVVFIGEGFRT
jgi:dipeptidyl aminopeptidase/acylaminoacyl peptidase